jgi:hypothetical protein
VRLTLEFLVNISKHIMIYYDILWYITIYYDIYGLPANKQTKWCPKSSKSVQLSKPPPCSWSLNGKAALYWFVVSIKRHWYFDCCLLMCYFLIHEKWKKLRPPPTYICWLINPSTTKQCCKPRYKQTYRPILGRHCSPDSISHEVLPSQTLLRGSFHGS